MADQLQGLIDRIQKDGVNKAEAAAADIMAGARAQAAELVQAAEAKARAIIKKAETDSELYTQRGARALEQAARDIVLLVGGGVAGVVEKLMADEVNKALAPDVLKDLIARMAQAYMQKGMSDGRVELLLSPEDQETLKQFALENLRQELEKGLTLGADARIRRGFTITLDNGRVRHDFTDQAIAEAMADFLRPALADLVRAAVAEMKARRAPDSEKK